MDMKEKILEKAFALVSTNINKKFGSDEKFLKENMIVKPYRAV